MLTKYLISYKKDLTVKISRKMEKLTYQWAVTLFFFVWKSFEILYGILYLQSRKDLFCDKGNLCKSLTNYLIFEVQRV